MKKMLAALTLFAAVQLGCAGGGESAFDFVIYGDTRTRPRIHRKVMDAIATADPQLVIHSGDLWDGYSSDEWRTILQANANIARLLDSNKFLVARGNHESESEVLNFTPSIVRDDAIEYSFVEGGCFFVCVGINPARNLAWLEGQLKTPAAQNADWRIVYAHYPVYSTGPNTDYEGIPAFEALCDKYGVHLFFAGHDHIFERTNLMFNRKPVSLDATIDDYRRGTVYYVTGGGGAPRYSIKSKPWVAVQQSTLHHLELRAGPDSIEIVARKPDGEVFDTFVINRSPRAPDYAAPTPNPMTFASPPAATGDASIAMTASGATDAKLVEYYFGSITPGGHDSGWQDGTTYEDTNLTPATAYRYTVRTRDMSPNRNESMASSSASATTHPADTTTPTPNLTTWASVPRETSTSTVSMTAAAASDKSGVRYYFDSTSAGGHDSGWQDSPSYTDTGLRSGTKYTYRVRVADKSAARNETAFSASASATTRTGPAVWTERAVYAPGEPITIHFVNTSKHAKDWVGLFDDGDPQRNYITYNFLKGKALGTTTFPKGLRREGAYEARLLFKDSYKLEAFFDFIVSGEAGDAK